MRLAAAAFACALIGVGCSSNRGAEEPGTVNFLIESMPANLDPRIGTDAQSQHLDGLIFDSLLAHDAQMNIVADLAERWEARDPLTYVVPFKAGREIPRWAAAYVCRCEIHIRFDSRWNGEDAEAWSVSNGHSGRGPGRFDGRVSFARAVRVIFMEPDETGSWGLCRADRGRRSRNTRSGQDRFDLWMRLRIRRSCSRGMPDTSETQARQRACEETWSACDSESCPMRSCVLSNCEKARRMSRLIR